MHAKANLSVKTAECHPSEIILYFVLTSTVANLTLDWRGFRTQAIMER